MIAPEVADRLATVILGSTRCRGFALVVFYDDDGSQEMANRRDALINYADPLSAAEMLREVSAEFYRSFSGGGITRAR